ncbi:MAG: glutamate racemase [Patescibacteria group bacterium]|jgi:glutamate racemase
MIGVFDSGLGGLVIMKELDKQFPEYSFLYLGDNARAPYGSKTPEQVYEYTLQAVEYLFAEGCELVILACNTASANALRRIQQEVLPAKYPGKRVLGILVPTVEQVHGGTIGIFATPGTVKSEAYVHEIMKRQPTAEVFQVACPTLVGMIEAGESAEKILVEVEKYVAELKMVMGEKFPPENVLLGCTHFPLVHHLFVKALPASANVYDQASMVAKSLRGYLLRHLELDAKLAKSSSRTFMTTGEAGDVEKKASAFYGVPVSFETVKIGL